MNAKQAAREAAKRIEQLEDFNRRATHEIKSLNACIDSVISGQMSFCDWCEDRNECQRECKGVGCGEWWLAYDLPAMPEEVETDDSKGILSAGPEG